MLERLHKSGRKCKQILHFGSLICQHMLGGVNASPVKAGIGNENDVAEMPLNDRFPSAFGVPALGSSQDAGVDEAMHVHMQHGASEAAVAQAIPRRQLCDRHRTPLRHFAEARQGSLKTDAARAVSTDARSALFVALPYF
jgi:hypothetical protein